MNRVASERPGDASVGVSSAPVAAAGPSLASQQSQASGEYLLPTVRFLWPCDTLGGLIKSPTVGGGGTVSRRPLTIVKPSSSVTMRTRGADLGAAVSATFALACLSGHREAMCPVLPQLWHLRSSSGMRGLGHACAV